MKFKLSITKSYEGHKGRPGQVGGSQPKSAGSGPSQKQPYQGTSGRMSLGEGKPSVNMVDASGDYYLPARKRALREAEMNGAARTKAMKKLGWDSAQYRENAMTLMQDAQDEIERYGSIDVNDFLAEEWMSSDFGDVPQDEDANMEYRDNFVDWGRSIINAYKKAVRRENLAPSSYE